MTRLDAMCVRMQTAFLAGLMFVVGLALSACQASESTEATPGQPPNIVLIMADDLGYGDLGSYGQTEIETPYLDRMAHEGMRFTQFYAGSTVCAPSRSALMTGLHTGHTPIRGNRETFPIGQAPLPDSTVTMAEVLREAGYATGAFGKWGLGGPGSVGTPVRQGFDRFFGYLGQRRAHFYYPEFLFHEVRANAEGDVELQRVALPGNRVQDDPERHPGAGHPIERGTYSHDRIMNETLDFVRAQASAEQPFFAYLPVTIPHAELLVPDSARAAYQHADGESVFTEEPFEGGHYSAQPMPYATYAAMITRLDAGIGRLLDTLETLGIAENTIVLFTSDNGPHAEGGADPSFFTSSGPLRGMKRDLYEGGIRVPMIAWGPGRVPAGATSDLVWAAWDLLPTFAELAGQTPPPGIDGLSVVPTLTDRAAEQRQHDYLYWEFYEHGSAQAVRMGRWKAVRQPMMTGPIELYDLEADLGEHHDITDAHPDVVDEIERIMRAAHTSSPDWTPPSVAERAQ